MADELVDHSRANEHPDDFAAIAERLTKTDPDAPKPPVAAAPKKVDAPATPKADSKSKIPDGLFETPPATGDPVPPKVDEPPTSDFDKIEDPTFRDEKRKAQWDEVKKKGREFEQQARDNAKKAADLEAKIAAYEAKGKDTDALNEKLAKLEKEHADAMALVRKVNAELDPEYQKKFGEGRRNLMAQAKTIVEESGGNPQDIETALNLSGKPRADALGLIADSMSSFQASRLGRLVDELSNLDSEAAKVRSNPEEYLRQREAENEANTRREGEEKAKHANLAFDSAFSLASSKLEVLRKVDGMPEWNEQADGIQARAKNLWQNNRDMTVAAQKFVEAEAMPVFRQLFLDQRKEATDAKAETEALRAELKGLYNRGPKTTGSSASKQGATVDFADHWAGLVNGSIQPPASR